MRIFRRTLVAGALAFGLAASGSASAQFTNTYFFGDSLTDSGSYAPGLPPGTGKFTTNPGPVWAELFAQYYGFSAKPANQSAGRAIRRSCDHTEAELGFGPGLQEQSFSDGLAFQ